MEQKTYVYICNPHMAIKPHGIFASKLTLDIEDIYIRLLLPA